MSSEKFPERERIAEKGKYASRAQTEELKQLFRDERSAERIPTDKEVDDAAYEVFSITHRKEFKNRNKAWTTRRFKLLVIEQILKTRTSGSRAALKEEIDKGLL